MTSPNFADPPIARYSASVSSLSEGNTVAPTVKDRFLEPSQAREWVRRQGRAQAGSGQMRVEINDLIPQPHLPPGLYALEGSPEQIVRALEDDWVPATEIPVADFGSATEFRSLAQLYGQVTAEAARNKWDNTLATKRDALRQDVGAAVDRLAGPERDRAVAEVAAIDLIPLARPIGAFTAVLDFSDRHAPGMRAGSGDRPVSSVASSWQRFDSASHAREWLSAQCGLAGAEGGGVRALVVTTGADGASVTLRSEVGRASEVAARLLEQVEYDGALFTGMASVDRQRLAALVEAYQDAGSDAPVFAPVSADVSSARIGLAPSRYSRLGSEIAEMVTDPRLKDQLAAVRPVLGVVDAHRSRGPNAVSNTVGCASSGFVQADLQIALDQHHVLTAEMAEMAGPEQRRAAALAGEVRQRIEALLPDPLLTATERIAVREDVRRAIETPKQGYSPVFEMPTPAAIRQRADEVLDARYQAGPERRGVDVDNVMRLYQLTQLAAERSTHREAEALRLTVADLRRNLEPRIAKHPHLNVGEKLALRSVAHGLGFDPHQEIPTQRAEYVDAPVPVERMAPPAADTIDRYTIGFHDPRNPQREFLLRADRDRWTLRAYEGYEAHPNLRRSQGVAGFSDGSALLSALQEGTVVTSTDSGEGRRRLDRVEVPAEVRELVGKAQQLRRAQNTGSGAEAGRAQKPQAAVAPRTDQQRRRQSLMARQQRPGRHRKLG